MHVTEATLAEYVNLTARQTVVCLG